jgi:aminoglycoside 6'-N-acetyltransferase
LAPDEISFAPLTEADLPMLARWLERPHVRRWWGDPKAEIAGIRAGLGDPGFGPHLFFEGGRAAGYIQWWRPDGSWRIPVDAPPGTTRGIDLSIAEPTDCGRGLGPRVVRAFVERLAAQGIRRFLIDPHPDNAAARRAYAKAGFAPVVEGTHTEGPYVLMVLDLPEPAKALP